MGSLRSAIVRELPRGFDRSNAEHLGRLLLVTAKMGELPAPDPLLIAAVLGFRIEPHGALGLHGRYDLIGMTIWAGSRREEQRRRIVGHELAHVAQEMAEMPKPHDEAFTERIRLAAAAPAWALRAALAATSGDWWAFCAHFPLLNEQELLLRLSGLPRFPSRARGIFSMPLPWFIDRASAE